MFDKPQLQSRLKSPHPGKWRSISRLPIIGIELLNKDTPEELTKRNWLRQACTVKLTIKGVYGQLSKKGKQGFYF